MESNSDIKESYIDVLIIGAGPAGLMAAEWLAKYSKQYGIKTRIVDKRAYELDIGQADGLNCRTLEIFESLNFFEKIDKEGCRMSEVSFWNPHPETGVLSRTGRIPVTIPGLSRFQPTVLHQNRIEAHLIDDITLHSDGKLVIERGVYPESLEIDESRVDDISAHPMKITLRHLLYEESIPNDLTTVGGIKSGLYRSSLISAEEEERLYQVNDDGAKREIVFARYVIGADGAHSWTRRTLGINMEGDQTSYVWAVMDLHALTNFPDIRKLCMIHSADSGSVMVIPQERGLVRLYIQLPQRLQPGEKFEKTSLTAEVILKAAQDILKPYWLEPAHIEWISGYRIGQRLTSSFSRHNRIFLAGDACHTHSPKAGQGMNTGMQDSFNLAWKLGHVIAGLARPELLETYSAERQVVAKNLIDFDHKFSRLFSGKPATDVLDEEHISLEEFQEVFHRGNLFAAGMSIEYGQSIVVSKDGPVVSRQELAPHLHVGKRFFSTQVVNVASATADQLTTRMLTNGAFRLLVFAGNIAEEKYMKRLRRLAEYLDGPDSVVSKYTPSHRPRDSVVDVITIHSSPREEVELYSMPMPSIFPPHTYTKVYVDGPSYHRGDGHAYEVYGISKEVGALIVVRPDQYVGLIVGLEDTEALDAYFSGMMIPANEGSPASKVELVYPPQSN